MKKLSRRDFIHLSTLAAAGYLTGCATNPVTGRSQLMLVSENQEIAVDRENRPHQFSADYGVSQDTALNTYLQQTGSKLAAISHRPGMPYSFQCVNAVYVNAYAFPGGTIAATRGILLNLDNEAELAALLGHELGHVNARHTAQQMSKGTLLQALAGGVALYAGSQNQTYGELAQQLGAFGTGALLASYSRDNEREADSLGLEYMGRAGYNPAGVTGLMELLTQQSKHQPSMVELMFATHPMSSERYENAKAEIRQKYSGYANYPLYRERYRDNTARLRAMKEAISEMQKGEEEMGKKNFPAAEEHLKTALKQAPDDYTALILMAKALLLQKKSKEAALFAKKAKQSYPQEGQGDLISGLANLEEKEYGGAHEAFAAYEQKLPGVPTITFYLGRSSEGMGKRDEAARSYYAYLQKVNQGEMAKYAYNRLLEWGYVKK